MNRLGFWICGILLSCALSAQTVVFVGTEYENEFGRGILKTRSGACFIILPNHVVGEDPSGTFRIYGEKARLSSATFVQSFPNDLAVLRITGGEEQYCTQWSLHPEYHLAIEQITSCYLEVINVSGSIDKKPAEIVGTDDMTLQIRLKGDAAILKGMSGSSVFAQYGGARTYLGMLMEVDEGIGLVLQADNIMAIVDEFFVEKKVKGPVDSLSLNQEKSDYLAQLKSDIKFINNHFKSIQNGSGRSLANDFSLFVGHIQNTYNAPPEWIQSDNQKKTSCQNAMKEIMALAEECRRIIEKNPDRWDVDATPPISLMLIYLEEIETTLKL